MEKEKLSNLLYYVLVKECGGESIEGQNAVASVIVNRAIDMARICSGRPIDYIDKVLLKPKQFSCLNNIKNKNDIKIENQLIANIKNIVDGIMNGTFFATGSWKYYYNPKLASPIWGASLKDKVVIGNHLFGSM